LRRLGECQGIEEIRELRRLGECQGIEEIREMSGNRGD